MIQCFMFPLVFGSGTQVLDQMGAFDLTCFGNICFLEEHDQNHLLVRSLAQEVWNVGSFMMGVGHYSSVPRSNILHMTDVSHHQMYIHF